ncbi:hypothetical protein PCASD_07806 [Puccinia coronata f. sp. avenae]|nr:hypothetical protein PCASD_07806 [Puccinia coronata f. sp. avenae]
MGGGRHSRRQRSVSSAIKNGGPPVVVVDVKGFAIMGSGLGGSEDFGGKAVRNAAREAEAAARRLAALAARMIDLGLSTSGT